MQDIAITKTQDMDAAGAKSKGLMIKKTDGTTPSGKKIEDGNRFVGDGMGPFMYKFNGIDYDLNTSEGKGLLKDAINSNMKNSESGTINGQKVGTQGAQWEASKANALAVSSQAKTIEQAEDIANMRHAGKQGSTEAVVPKTGFLSRFTARA